MFCRILPARLFGGGILRRSGLLDRLRKRDRGSLRACGF